MWCQKTLTLTEKDFTYAFQRIEFEITQRKRDGEEDLWPPDYASFIGYSQRPHGEIAHRYFPHLALPDKTAQERADAVGKVVINDLKNMFANEA